MPSKGQEAVDHVLTQRDLDYTPDDGNRYEIIDGEIFVTPFPSYAHQRAATRLVTLLDAHVHQRQLGQVFAAGLKVVLGEPTGLGPDVVYISAGRMDNMRDDGFYGPPDLIVEVISSKPQLDRYVKFNKYAAAGVPYYWIVDPGARTLVAYRLDGKRYRVEIELGGDAIYAPDLFSGLSIPLADLWV